MTGKMPVLLEIITIRHDSLFRLAVDVILQLRGAWVCHCEE
jgi:hypothetical protein